MNRDSNLYTFLFIGLLVVVVIDDAILFVILVFIRIIYTRTLFDLLFVFF